MRELTSDTPFFNDEPINGKRFSIEFWVPTTHGNYISQIKSVSNLEQARVQILKEHPMARFANPFERDVPHRESGMNSTLHGDSEPRPCNDDAIPQRHHQEEEQERITVLT